MICDALVAERELNLWLLVAAIPIFRRSFRSVTFCEPSEKRCVVSYICTAPWSIRREPIIGE